MRNLKLESSEKLGDLYRKAQKFDCIKIEVVFVNFAKLLALMFALVSLLSF